MVKTATRTRGNRTADIVIGTGACYSVGSDRYPATVISKTAQTVTVQDDTFTAARDHNYFGSQDYDFTPNPNGATMVCRWSDKKGGWMHGTRRIHIGARGAYRNPSF